MDHNEDFLQDLYQNTKTGEESIASLLKHVNQNEMKDALVTQMQGYAQLSSKAKQQIYHLNQEPHESGPLSKMMTQTMSRMSVMNDSSPTHIAEMVIQGSTMGIVNATEHMNKYADLGKDVSVLANEVVRFEQKSIDRMKEFL